MKIMIVEDVAMVRTLLSQILKLYGEIDYAENGMEAVQKFRNSLTNQSPYDIIFLDIMMPVLDGHQTLLKIREIEKEHSIASKDQVQIIMTSALSDKETVINSLKEGCNDYIIKPFNKQKVIDKLVKVTLRKYRKNKKQGT